MKTKLILASVVLIGLTLRLYLAAVMPGGYDLMQLERSASIFAHGGNIYTEQHFYNYSPAIGLPLAAAYAAPFPFRFTWRLFIILANLVNAVLIARLTRRPAWTFMLFWLNPALILMDGNTGQFEALALLPLLIAIHLPRASFAGGLLALLVKHLTLPLTWALYVYRAGPKRAIWWLVAAGALFALSFTPYLPDGAPRIIQRVLLYRSWGGYGFGSPLLFYAAIIVLPFVARRLRLALPDTLLFCALGWATFVYGMGSNNIVLVLALGMLRPSRWLIPLTLVTALFASPWTAQLETVINGFNTNSVSWLICLGWLMSIVWNRREHLWISSLLSKLSCWFRSSDSSSYLSP